jgi:hypothetical protein
MQSVTIHQIDERLQQLPAEKLIVVYDFVSYLVEREREQFVIEAASDARETMLASEAALSGDWNRPEEDAAWAHL